METGSWTSDQSQRTAPFLEAYPGYVVSYDGECQNFREQEADPGNVPNRTFIARTPEELEPGSLEDLWYMGIIVCPGEDVGPIAAAVAQIDAEIRTGRISLYLAPGVDELDVVKRWKEARIGPPSGVYPFDHEDDSWRNFHKRFGNHHAAQVDEDRRDYPNHIQQYAKASR